MRDKENIIDILLEFYEEYQGNIPNRPMIPSIYANKIIGSMQEEPTIPDIVDEHWWEMLGEEPVSEDMWEASKQYALRQVLASTDAEMTEQAYLSLKLFSGFEIAVAHKDGANWQKEQDKQWLAEEHKHIFAKGRDSMKQQMMKNAIERNVQIDAGGYPYIDVNVELYDYDKDIPLAKEGDKVMVVVIKEE